MDLTYIKNKIIEAAMNGSLDLKTEYDLPYSIKLNGVDKALNLHLEKFISKVYTLYKKGIDMFTEEEQKKIYYENIDKGKFDPNWYQYDEDIFLTERTEKINDLFYDMFGLQISYFDLDEFIEIVENEVENIVKKNIQNILSKLKEIEKWVDMNGPYTKVNRNVENILKISLVKNDLIDLMINLIIFQIILWNSMQVKLGGENVRLGNGIIEKENTILNLWNFSRLWRTSLSL